MRIRILVRVFFNNAKFTQLRPKNNFFLLYSYLIPITVKLPQIVNLNQTKTDRRGLLKLFSDIDCIGKHVRTRIVSYSHQMVLWWWRWWLWYYSDHCSRHYCLWRYYLKLSQNNMMLTLNKKTDKTKLGFCSKSKN